jgi:hypothetical protein
MPYVVPPRCLVDILRCGVYGTSAMAYQEKYDVKEIYAGAVAEG